MSNCSFARKGNEVAKSAPVCREHGNCGVTYLGNKTFPYPVLLLRAKITCLKSQAGELERCADLGSGGKYSYKYMLFTCC